MNEFTHEYRRRTDRLFRTSEGGPLRFPKANEKLFHDMQAQQVELESQNQELRKTQEELDTTRARYFDLYDQAPVGYATLSETGLIIEANLTLATMLGVYKHTLAGQSIARFIVQEDQDIFYQFSRHPPKKGSTGNCGLRMVRTSGVPFWAHLTTSLAQNPDSASLHHVVISDDTERKQREDELKTAHKELEQRILERTEALRQLAVEATLVEERERCTIARELHDDLGQLFHIAKLKLSALAQIELAKHGKTLVQELDALMGAASESVRALTSKLSPPLLNTLGLVPALSWLAEDFEHTYEVQIHLADDGQPKLTSQARSNIIFQAVRELLINVAKHAQSDEAWVDISTDGKNLILEVRDNGRGMDEQLLTQTRGFGLRNIRERIHQLQGEMSILSSHETGTLVTLRMPLDLDSPIALKETP